MGQTGRRRVALLDVLSREDRRRLLSLGSATPVPAGEAKEIFGEWQEPKPYIRIVPQPS